VPFTKVGQNRYRSPSGKIFTKKQVQAYHASDGFTKTRRKTAKKKGTSPKKTRRRKS
jgi:uncharacterized protein YaiI (UPF0178 family)